MPNRNTRNRSGMTRTQMLGEYVEDRNDELVDAIVTAVALVASADGRIEPVERRQLIDFMSRSGFLSVVTRDEILDAFDCRVRQCENRGGTLAAINILGRLAGRSTGRLVIQAGEQVAAADGHLHPDEMRVLRRVRIALSAPCQAHAPYTRSPRHSGDLR